MCPKSGSQHLILSRHRVGKRCNGRRNAAALRTDVAEPSSVEVVTMIAVTLRLEQ